MDRGFLGNLKIEIRARFLFPSEQAKVRIAQGDDGQQVIVGIAANRDGRQRLNGKPFNRRFDNLGCIVKAGVLPFPCALDTAIGVALDSHLAHAIAGRCAMLEVTRR